MVTLIWTLGVGFWLVAGVVVARVTQDELNVLGQLEGSRERERMRSKRAFVPANPAPEEMFTKVGK